MPGIVVGALALAAMTSLPDVVAAIWLAAGGRDPEHRLNSNALNITIGLLRPPL